MANTIQIRRDTLLNWGTVNPVLAQGELALELDTKKQKVGDGLTAWNDLSYVNTGGLSESQLIDTFRFFNKSQLLASNNLSDTATLNWDLLNTTNPLLIATSLVGNTRTLLNSVISDAITTAPGIRGNSFILTFKQDATGGRTILFDTNYTVIGDFDLEPNAITKIFITIEDSKGYVILTNYSGVVSQITQVSKTTTSNITSEDLSDDNHSLTNKNVLIKNGSTDINFTIGATENQIFSIQKEGTGTITFLASSGKTLRQVSGENSLYGALGSTATISVVGTVVSLRISNA